jgi:hypothetical protein
MLRTARRIIAGSLDIPENVSFDLDLYNEYHKDQKLRNNAKNKEQRRRV